MSFVCHRVSVLLLGTSTSSCVKKKVVCSSHFRYFVYKLEQTPLENEAEKAVKYTFIYKTARIERRKIYKFVLVLFLSFKETFIYVFCMPSRFSISSRN